MENKLPSCLENRFSLKALTVIGVDALRKAYTSDYQMMFVTPYGIICGDLDEVQTIEKLKSEIKAEGSAKVDLSLAVDERNKFLENLEANGKAPEISDSGGVINLKNVTIYRDNMIHPVLTIDTLLLFADQIISVSLIPRER